MSDQDLRELERSAALGDSSARMKLLGERLRRAPGGGQAAVGVLERRILELLARATYGVTSRHAGIPTLDDVAGVVLKGLHAPAVTSGLIWRSEWTWYGRRQARVLIVAVKAGGPRLGEMAIGVGVTVDTRSENSRAVRNIWPALHGGFPLESEHADPKSREVREGLAVLWATNLRERPRKTTVRARVEVAEWWARERLGRWGDA
jgi:hypothetical protein